MTAEELVELLIKALGAEEALKDATVSRVQGNPHEIGVMMPDGSTFFVTVEL